MRIVLAVIAASALSACATTERPVPVAGGGGHACRNDMLAQFKGSTATQQLGVDIQTASHARTVRWVPKGGIITMDFRADRATVQLDENGKVESARCG